MERLKICDDSIGLVYSRVLSILSIIQDEMDINKELNVILTTYLKNINIIKDEFISVKVYYSNYLSKEEKTIDVILTEYEINDLNLLYRYIKSNILYNE